MKSEPSDAQKMRETKKAGRSWKANLRMRKTCAERREIIMENEYRRFLKTQFGKKSYADFARSVRAGINSPLIINKSVYREMYHGLQGLQPVTLLGRHRQLEEAILRVIRIGKAYRVAVSMYLAAVLLLLLLNAGPVLTAVGLGLITLAFAFKTAEYLSNKFCYVDVRIIITYKTALERVLLENDTKLESQKI